jgi:hypothetical protein
MQEKENEKELRKGKKAKGDQSGPASKSALAQFHPNPKGYPSEPSTH